MPNTFKERFKTQLDANMKLFGFWFIMVIVITIILYIEG